MIQINFSRMKSCLGILMFFCCMNLHGQVDIFKEGLEGCLPNELNQFVVELETELNKFIEFELGFSKKDNNALAEAICEGLPSQRFKINPNSYLAQLIKKGIKDQFWIHEPYVEEKTIVDGLELEIIPPGGKVTIEPDSLEQSYINPTSKYINCSKDYTFHKGMSVYFAQYEKFKVASSVVKVCGMKSFFESNDYQLESIRHFLLFHSICQRIIHVNDYYKEF